jgi:alkylation response protein AidB-like acyl-CoA dehydrogenase
MRFSLSEQQTQMQAMLARFLSADASLERVRSHAAGDGAVSARLMAGLAELGLTGLCVATDHGGLDLTWLDAMAVAEEMGRAVAPVPFLPSLVLASRAISAWGSQAQKARWLPAFLAGQASGGVGLSDYAAPRGEAGVSFQDGALTGSAQFVLHPHADVLVIADRSGRLFLAETGAPGMHITHLTTIDLTRAIGNITFEGVAASPLPAAGVPDAARLLLDAGRVLLAADTLGAAQLMLDRAIAYARQREQFGRPIGSFQAVKHMCAEMAAGLEPCRALVWYAAHALDTRSPEAPVLACHAKAHVSEIGTFIARTATEVHGGMGFTDLLGLHYWFKRIGFNRQLLGGPQAVRADAARLRGYGR